MKNFYRNPCVMLLAIMTAFFVYGYFWWQGIAYTNFGSVEGRCFSANGNYYIDRYMSPFRTQFALSLDPIGVAKLYDKSGRLLYSGTTTLDPQAGPNWVDWVSSDGRPKYSVGFVGYEGVPWRFDLAQSPGISTSHKNCRSAP